MRTVSEITGVIPQTDAERAWADRMGTDYRRAWETAPCVSAMIALAFDLTGRDGYRRFLSQLLTLLGGAPSLCDTLYDAMRVDAPPDAPAVMSLLENLPGWRRTESEIADLLHAHLSYENLRRLSDN